MKCPSCKSDHTRVDKTMNIVRHGEADSVRRYRKCFACRHNWVTVESERITIVKVSVKQK